MCLGTRIELKLVEFYRQREYIHKAGLCVSVGCALIIDRWPTTHPTPCKTMPPSQWTTIAAKKGSSTFSKIPPKWLLSESPPESVRNVISVPQECDILTAREVIITETSMANTLAHLRCGKWTAKEVTEGICKRAAIGHQLTNCLSRCFSRRR